MYERSACASLVHETAFHRRPQRAGERLHRPEDTFKLTAGSALWGGALNRLSKSSSELMLTDDNV